MASPSNCCSPCPETETVNVPGIEGDPGVDGTDGTDGINAYTTTTADFNLPAVSSTVAITVVETGWMVLGQIIFIENWGFVEVTALPSSTGVTVENLGYSVNAAPGTPCGSGAGVSPGGSQPSLSGLAASGANSDITSLSGLTTPLDESEGGTGLDHFVEDVIQFADPTAGTGSELTNAFTIVTIGATAISIVIPEAGTWRISGYWRLFFDAVTNGTPFTITTKLRRTNNTAADIANAGNDYGQFVASTAETRKGLSIPFGTVDYVTANTNDVITLQAKTSVAVPDTSGKYRIDQANLIAEFIHK